MYTEWQNDIPAPTLGPLELTVIAVVVFKDSGNHLWPGRSMSSVCDGHSIYVKLRLQTWAASVPSFPLPGNNSRRSRRAKISILWDKGKEQSSKTKKRKAFTNPCFFFFLSPSSTMQPKENEEKPCPFFPSSIPEILVFLKCFLAWSHLSPESLPH